MSRNRVSIATLACAALVVAGSAQATHKGGQPSENCTAVIAKQEARVLEGKGPQGGPKEGGAPTNCDHSYNK